MKCVRALVVVIGLLLSWQRVEAQDLTRYRSYALESSLESILAVSAGRAANVTTLHERPAVVRELEWRAPYVTSESARPDPVEAITFGFLDDALYQMVVTYSADRTSGLTNNDLIASLSGAYGTPARKSPARAVVVPKAVSYDSIVIAQWDSATSSLMLFRGAYSKEYQLVLLSKALSARASTAIRAAIRLDAAEAPRRELEQRTKDAADETAARDKARTDNKAAFRP